MPTKIEWAEESLNIVTGCTKISAGCLNCYAEKMAKRLKAMGRPEYQLATDEKGFTGHLTFVEERLQKPYKWRKPKRVFVNSMSDSFHEDLDDVRIYQMFLMVEHNPKHVFIFVTKRAKRAKEILNKYCAEHREGRAIPNLWLLVTIENRKTADERLPHLLETRAKVRGLSIEPLLERLDFPELFSVDGDLAVHVAKHVSSIGFPIDFIDWVIVGGESGPGARPMHPDWVREIRDVCENTFTPFFFKQWGEFVPFGGVSMVSVPAVLPKKYMWFDDHVKVFRVGKKKAGRILDGRTWDETP